MSELFGVVARLYPALVVLAALAFVAGVLSAWSRMSSGSVSAGPAAIHLPPTAGLEVVPWPAQMIEDTLAADPDALVHRLVRRSADAGLAVAVPADLTARERLDAVLTQLEAALHLDSDRVWADQEGSP